MALLYADDMVLLEKNWEQLQEVLAVMQQALEEWGMQMSVPKTKFMQLGRGHRPKSATADLRA